MVSEKIIFETIERMKQAGLSDDLIINTLMDVGISKEEAANYLAKASGNIVQAKPAEPELETEEIEGEEPEEEMHEIIAEKTASKIKEHLISAGEEHAVLAQNTQAALEDHSDKLDSIESKINALSSQPVATSGSADVAQFKYALEELKKEVAETKALASATKTLMEKILDINRQILTKL